MRDEGGEFLDFFVNVIAAAAFYGIVGLAAAAAAVFGEQGGLGVVGGGLFGGRFRDAGRNVWGKKSWRGESEGAVKVGRRRGKGIKDGREGLVVDVIRERRIELSWRRMGDCKVVEGRKVTLGRGVVDRKRPWLVMKMRNVVGRHL